MCTLNQYKTCDYKMATEKNWGNQRRKINTIIIAEKLRISRVSKFLRLLINYVLEMVSGI